MSVDIERETLTKVLIREQKKGRSLTPIEKNVPAVNVDTPTNTLELYKKYLSCLCAVCITCIVLTFTLLIHLIGDTTTDTFQVLRSRVLDVKDSDLSSCYSYELYSHHNTNQSSEPALFLTPLIDQERTVSRSS